MAVRDGPDRQTFRDLDVSKTIRDNTSRAEAFRQGLNQHGAGPDVAASQWGFDLEDIAVTTHWWHGRSTRSRRTGP